MAAYNQYDGRHLYVRWKTETKYHKARGKVISIREPGRVEVQPFTNTPHGHTIWLDVHDARLSWWHAETKKHHPDWKEPVSEKQLGGYPDGTIFYVLGENGFWRDNHHHFVPDLSVAREYDRHDKVLKAVSHLRHHSQCEYLTKDQAITHAQKNNWPIVAQRVVDEKAGATATATSVVHVHARDRIDPAKKAALLKHISSFDAAFQLFTEETNRLVAALEEVVKEF